MAVRGSQGRCQVTAARRGMLSGYPQARDESTPLGGQLLSLS